MKDFSGKSIQRYFYSAERGELTGTYGGGQVRTGDLKLPKGIYTISVQCVNDTGMGKKLTTGDFQVRVQKTNGTVLLSRNHSGNVAYDLAFTTSRVVKFDSDTYIYALVQTGSTTAVGGGVMITLEAAKTD